MSGLENLPYFAIKLQEQFQAKKARNKRYSLRSYAQFLEMNPGTVSSIIKGKRLVPLQEAAKVMQKLSLAPKDQEMFLLSLGVNKPPAESSYKLDPSRYAVLFDEWEYFVILAVFRLADFKSTATWIAAKTGINEPRVNECLENLEDLQVISRKGPVWERNHKNLYSPHDIPSRSLQQAHLNTLELARQMLSRVPVQERDYSFLTVALDEKQFKKLKKLTLKFRDDVFELDEKSKKGDLYRVNLQCFPILPPKSN
ncbi:DUF4423 domain-containing protein [Bdellovibrio bacteriovorus]|uniref:DUF4423 domain-containing protein n=1 Tax=Bdellovibrio bacteriovorus str. Tiberius TaxID=1069642 RepID=K7YP15_BDEBC|nr:DUF4423 domain-containing protein [Bdellovibrio bacteriovorus]AFY01551.1 hypothetical protein Bdt_1864 [Bdellovibrio bacteriovorus str. Tiberius]